MTIVFENNGVLDMEAVKTFGASIKEEGSIGQFGTGLKYAIATLLRNEQRVVIYSGGEQYVLHHKTKLIRDKAFDVVYMNDEALGFTTALGKGWEMWMAFRELYCNALDEGGCVRLASVENFKDKNKTYVVCDGDQIMREYYDRGQNFLSSKPIFSTASVEIHAGPSDYLFYRGVRVYTATPGSLFTYNLLKKQTLTEDRTLSYYFSAMTDISNCVARIDNSEMIKKILTAGKHKLEGELSFPTHGHSEAFVAELLKENKRRPEQLNSSAAALVKYLSPGDAYGAAVPLNALEQSQYDKALAFANRLGFRPQDYKIQFVETIGSSIYALALMEKDEIVISKRVFNEGTKLLALALIEETIHLREHLHDCTRGFQTYVLNKMISIGEELQGGPL